MIINSQVALFKVYYIPDEEISLLLKSKSEYDVIKQQFGLLLVA